VSVTPTFPIQLVSQQINAELKALRKIEKLSRKMKELAKQNKDLETQVKEQAKQIKDLETQNKLWIKNQGKWLTVEAKNEYTPIPEYTLEIEVEKPGNFLLTFTGYVGDSRHYHVSFVIDGIVIREGEINKGAGFWGNKDNPLWMPYNVTQFVAIEKGWHKIQLAHISNGPFSIIGGEIRCLYIR